MQVLGDLRRLPRARLAHQNHHRVVTDHVEQRLADAVDWQKGALLGDRLGHRKLGDGLVLLGHVVAVHGVLLVVVRGLLASRRLVRTLVLFGIKGEGAVTARRRQRRRRRRRTRRRRRRRQRTRSAIVSPTTLTLIRLDTLPCTTGWRLLRGGKPVLLDVAGALRIRLHLILDSHNLAEDGMPRLELVLDRPLPLPPLPHVTHQHRTLLGDDGHIRRWVF